MKFAEKRAMVIVKTWSVRLDSSQGYLLEKQYQFVATKSILKRVISKERLIKRGIDSLFNCVPKRWHIYLILNWTIVCPTARTAVWDLLVFICSIIKNRIWNETIFSKMKKFFQSVNIHTFFCESVRSTWFYLNFMV